MKTELIKSEIINQLEDLDKNIFYFNIHKCLELYFKIINYKLKEQGPEDLRNLYSSMNKSLEGIFIESSIQQEFTDNICKNYEPLIKKIYFVLLENDKINPDLQVEKKIHPIMEYLKILNKLKRNYQHVNDEEITDSDLTKEKTNQPISKIKKTEGTENYDKLYPSSLSFGNYKNFKEIEPKYLDTKYEYLIKAYILKNEQSHQVPLKSIKERLMSALYTIGASLIIIDFLNLELNECLSENVRNTTNFHAYIEGEKSRYINNSEKFVPLSFKHVGALKEKTQGGFIEEIITNTNCRLRILGEGGSGKTTTLQNLIYKDCIKWIENKEFPKIPVFIILSIMSSNETITSYIAKKLSIEIEFVEELIKLNEVTLYIDGLNEIVGNESKNKKILEIKYLLNQYPTLRLVVTDRYEFDSYQNNVFGLPTFIVEKLNSQQQHEFVHKYCASSDIHHSNVLQILKNKTGIHDLLLKPLILARSIEIIKVENDLPEQESEIIERFIDIMLRREKDEKNDSFLNIDIFKNLLCNNANLIYKEYSSNKSIKEIDYNRLLVNTCDQLGIERVYAYHTLKLGFELEILVKNGDLINFFHQSYFEFFCSLYIRKFI
jgi:hypothetical protein